MIIKRPVPKTEFTISLGRLSWRVGLAGVFQSMANRLRVGEVRYGTPTPSQNYLKRLIGVVKKYERTGNRELLLDAANYAVLEFLYPIHEKAHYEPDDSQHTNYRV